MRKYGLILFVAAASSVQAHSALDQSHTYEQKALDQKDTSVQDVHPVEGETYVTNKTSQKLKIQWQTRLSSTIQSPVQSQTIPASTNRYKTGHEVEWFKQHQHNMINPWVYVLEVKVFDVGGSLLSEEKVHITRSYQDVASKNAKNDLHLTIYKNYTVGYALFSSS